MRITYSPHFDVDSLTHPSFQSTGQTAWFIENGDYQNGGQGDWGIGMGILKVFFDDLFSPIITTPINLESTLKLDRGKATVGFTGSTGDTHWQTQDILLWTFDSLTLDGDYTPPLIINGEGSFECEDVLSCPHLPDLQHFIRSN